MRRAFAAILIAALAAASPAAAAPAAPPDTIRIGYLRLANAQLVSKALGFHERAGLKVEWIPFETGGQVNAAMAAGRIDFGAVGTPPAAAGIASGLPYRGLFILNMLGSVEGLVVRRDLAMASPADLAGKRIAVPFGSTSYYLLLSLMRLENIPEDTVALIDMTPSQAQAAWDRGEIDGAWLWETALHQMVTNGGRVLIDNREMARRGLPVGDIAVVASALAKARPDLVARYVQSECAAITFWRDHPEQTAQIIASELGVDPGDARRMIDGTGIIPCGEQRTPTYLGMEGTIGAFTRSLDPIAQFLFQRGRLAKPPADDRSDDFFDLRFLDDADICSRKGPATASRD